eukprot:scaffold353_cov185-Amphora_coffeaeformis.AAC.65
MPTFASIGFHPALRSRLVVATGQQQSQPNNNDNGVEVTMTRPLETPHSLLLNAHAWRLRGASDDPHQTRAPTTAVAPHEVIALRRQVARSLLDQTKCGKRQRQIQQQQQQDDNNNDTTKRVRLDGFLSVSDILAWQSMQTRQQPSLCTGMAAVDALLSDTPNSVVTSSLLIVGEETNSKDEETTTSTIGRGGISWGTVLQISGGPGAGKTQFALQLAAIAANRNIKVHYFVPAFASPTSLARRLAQLLLMADGDGGNTTVAAALSNILLDTFGDPHELVLALAQFEDKEWHHSSDNQSLRLIIVDGSSTTSLPPPRTWHRLARLYHVIVLVVTPATTASIGSIHLHVGNNDSRAVCQKHPQREKIGTVLSLNGKLPIASDE